MGKLTDELLVYLAMATPEQLNQDYEELKHCNEIGPLADDFVEIALEPFNKSPNYNYNNPEYSGLFCFY